jgi:two-component system NtrC family sensor kinase
VSAAEGVERVRIFDHKGQTLYSTYKEEIGDTVNMESIACTGCHSSAGTMPELLKEPKKWNIEISPEGYSVLKLVEPIYNEPACLTPDCPEQTEKEEILGFVEADLSLALFDKTRLKQVAALTGFTLIFLLAVSISLVIILRKIVTGPVTKLAGSMERVTAGDLDHSVNLSSPDELGLLANNFNFMIKDLKAAKDQMDSWAKSLEEEVSRKTEVIKTAHASLIQAEKLSSLGRLAAGIANELDEPLNEIAVSANLLKTRTTLDSAAKEDLNIIIEQAERSDNIMRNFLDFARAKPAEKGKVSINDVLSKTIYILKHQKRFNNIRIDTKTEDIPVMTIGDTSQFQQIFMNLLTNAADAMNEGGTITVATRKIIEDNESLIEVEFTDTGRGIRDEDIPRLFEPFFSTKPEEKGTGLGLSVSHGIAKHLGGDIKVKSVVGEGTSFFARFPFSKE